MGKSKGRAAGKEQVTLHPTTNVPLNQLILSASNVRKIYSEEAIDEMVDDIGRRGLLQSLLLRPMGEAEGVPLYEINAGGRRLRALQKLMKQKRIAPDALIPCIIKETGLAEDDSLTENVMRENLHPLDEFRAFKTMSDKGMSETDIAAAYRVTPTVVKQRLRLASASPTLLQAYTDDDISLEQLMAYCITDDHARQDAVFDQLADAQSWNKEPSDIKRLLTENSIRAQDRRVRFVGLDTYEAAGGYVERDMFDEQNQGYVKDTDLLNRLVNDKLHAKRDELLGKGWKWAVAALDIPYSEINKLDRITELEVQLTAKQEKQLAKLEKQRDALDEMDERDDEQEARLDAINAEIDALENPPPSFSAEDMARAGVFITVDNSGDLDISYGYVKDEDHAGADAGEAGGDTAVAGDADDGEDTATGLKPLADSLVQDLTAYRTQALKTWLGQDFTVAFITMLHAMCLEQFYSGYKSMSCLQAIFRDDFPAKAPGLDTWDATKKYEEREARLRKLLPESEEELWDALWKLSDGEREALFAHCTSATVNAVREKHNKRQNQIDTANQVAHALGLHMVGAGWVTTADNYLSRVSKPHIIKAVEEAKGEDTANLLTGLKKEGLVREAERLLSGTGWLPEPLRTVTPPTVNAAPDAEASALPAFLVEGAEGDAAIG